MNANPMTEQVARLVGNLLAEGKSICLPGVGTLYVERQPARRIDRRHMVPPCRTVQFSSQERGTSLVDEIARVLRVNGTRPEDPVPEAQKVYDRWIAQVREADTLSIVGVGVLRFKNFRPDEAFDRRLNPHGHEPVKVRAPRRFDAVLWIGIAAVVCVVGFTAWWWFGERMQRGELRAALSVRSGMPASVTESAALEASPADSLRSGSVAAPVAEAAKAAAGVADGPVAAQSAVEGGSAVPETSVNRGVSAGSPDAKPAEAPRGNPASGAGPATLVSGRNYVVMGVFSSEANARRAAHEASGNEVAIACGIYRFGSKFMVSPFESDDAEACRLFIRAHEERFPGMWTYTAR